MGIWSRFDHDTFLIIKKKIICSWFLWGRRNGSAVRELCRFCKGPEFSLQKPGGVAHHHLSRLFQIIPAPQPLKASALKRTHIH